MQIPILIESIEGERCCVRASEPFGLAAEGDNVDEAILALQQLIADRLSKGARLGVIQVPNGAPADSSPPFPADDLYQSDPSYTDMQVAIAEARRAEDQDEQLRGQGTGNP